MSHRRPFIKHSGHAGPLLPGSEKFPAGRPLGAAFSPDNAPIRMPAHMLREGVSERAAIGHADALLKTGALQTAIFNSANFSSIATDAKGVIQIFNVGAERMLGYAAAEVMNKITPADISDPQEVIARAKALSAELCTPITPGFEALVFKASRGIEDIYELTYIRKDGSRFPAVVSVTALRDPQDAIIGYLLIGTDNTVRQQIEEERKKLDQRLRDQHFYTRSLIESSIDALMTTDPRGIITDVNKQMEALTGCTRDELIGAPFKNYFTDSGRAEAGIKRVLAEGKVTNYELTARARNGALTVVSYNATTFHDRDRMLQGVFAAARDMTELKRYKQTNRDITQRRDAERSLEQMRSDQMRFKDEFFSHVSHELRSPLTAIKQFTSILLGGLAGELNKEQRAYQQIVLKNIQQLQAMIDDLVEVTRLESGKLAIELECASLADAVTDTLNTLEGTARTKGVTLSCDLLSELPPVHADRTRLRQILIILLDNAIKFTPKSGSATIHARLLPQDPHFLLVEVADTGCGISPDITERVFERMYQVSERVQSSRKGLGLGLYICKELV
ncbi:MAG TPA: PAS domain-containing sensor histidine kinase, partial [Gemmatimonadaceae bacterium]|nr:PAS domain-containing sensor histidine kinase [Gemmatimonadaceae bacterium]